MAGEVCERFRLMFFGNLHQDWSEFVLADLGVFQYESVPFDAASRAFQSRADVDRYLALHACRAAWTRRRRRRRARGWTPCWLRSRPAPAPILAGAAPRQVLLRIGQACERAGDWPAAERCTRNAPIRARATAASACTNA